MASRRELRRRIGATLAALFPGDFAITDTNTIELPYPVGEVNGSWVWHSGGSIHRALNERAAAAEPARIVTVSPPLPSTNVPIELWKADWPPTRINDLINAVIGELHGRTYIDNTMFDFCLAERSRVIPLEDNVTAIMGLEKRRMVHYVTLWTYGVWERTGGGERLVSEADSFDNQGSVAQRITIPASAASTTIESTSTSYIGLQGMTHIETWLKHRWDGNGAQPQVQLRLLDEDDVVQGTITIELEKDKWTYVQEELPSSLAGRIATLQFVLGPSGGQTFHVNGIWAVDVNTVSWMQLRWSVDWQVIGSQSTPQIEFHRERGWAFDEAPLSVVRVSTARDVLQLDDDADELYDRLSGYVVAKTLALAYAGISGGPQVDAQRYRQLADRQQAMARQLEPGVFPLLSDVVEVQRT